MRNLMEFFLICGTVGIGVGITISVAVGVFVGFCRIANM